MNSHSVELKAFQRNMDNVRGKILYVFKKDQKNRLLCFDVTE